MNPIDTPVNTVRPGVYYCDPGDIQRRMSTESVGLHIKDFGNGSLAGESDVIEDAIWDATDIINSFLYSLYRPEDLAQCFWIRGRATDIAVWYLFTRRGNSAPASVLERYKETLEWLRQIHDGKLEVPGCPVRWTQAPSFSNIRIDQRYPTFRVRVERPISDKSDAPFPQATDWSCEYDFII